jgi:hypothetical protein
LRERDREERKRDRERRQREETEKGDRETERRTPIRRINKDDEANTTKLTCDMQNTLVRLIQQVKVTSDFHEKFYELAVFPCIKSMTS